MRLRVPKRSQLDADLQTYFALGAERLASCRTCSPRDVDFDQGQAACLIGIYNDLMLADSPLSSSSAK